MDDHERQLSLLRPLSRGQRRLIKSSVEIEADDPEKLIYQHAVFCQTGLPYRNPGHESRVWERTQGGASLRVRAGEAFDPNAECWVEIGLPFGAKPRLVLAYLNGEAMRAGSPEVEVEDSLTAFVQRIGLSNDGRSIRTVKDQLSRLAVAEIRLALAYGNGHARQVNSHIVSGFDLWWPRDARQRVLWPSVVRLSEDYFNSLERHAVPLDERAIGALSHSAMALDLYCWLAYRLHQVSKRKPQFLTWKAAKDQFGWHYNAMYKFRQVFKRTLDIVLTQYRGARIDLDDKGLTLYNSPPPIKGRITLISKS